MSEVTARSGFTIDLPDVWVVRQRDGFDSLFSDLASAPGVDPDFVTLVGAEVTPVIEAAAEEGLVLLGGFVEALEPVPESPAVPTEVPFDHADIDINAIGAGLAVFEQLRPAGTIEELRTTLARTPARWVSAPEIVEVPCGRAVVTREVQAIHPPSLKRASDVLLVTYYVLPEAAPTSLLTMLFRTPSLGFATEFDEQFAMIVSTVEFVEEHDGAET
jgi:hypothetical protein